VGRFNAPPDRIAAYYRACHEGARAPPARSRFLPDLALAVERLEALADEETSRRGPRPA